MRFLLRDIKKHHQSLQMQGISYPSYQGLDYYKSFLLKIRDSERVSQASGVQRLHIIGLVRSEHTFPKLSAICALSAEIKGNVNFRDNGMVRG